MKALTLTQPWASLMALGYKQVETRSWKTQYRGPLAIHAAKGFPSAARQFAEVERAIGRVPARIPRGAVVCIIDLVDCQPTEDVALRISGLERHLGDYAPGRWAWLFEPSTLRVLPDPIPARGALSLWEWEVSRA
ncbi:hypothetical protein LCGC14_1716150 [marine sediment metagenome]|uniref:ASCH domain-containing protein n=1 Tax=marine sediment metagenome TaxID=412755 RepID=A0A0F9HDJ8_9ZZZZ